MKNLRILNLVSSRGNGGLERYPLDLAEEMKKRGHSPILVTTPDSFLEKRRQKNNIAGFSVEHYHYIDPRMIYHLWNFLRKNKVDIIHCHTSQDVWYGSYMKRIFPNMKLIYTQQMEPGKKEDFVHQWIYEPLDYVFAITQKVNEGLQTNCKIPEKKIETLYYGLDFEKFNPEIMDQRRLIKKFGLNPELPVVGQVGRLNPTKGQDVFIKAAIRIIENFQDVQFVLVGGPVSDGQQQFFESLKSKVNKSGHQEKIRFLGHQENIPEVMNILDVFCLTSDYEIFGKVNIEAQAMGVPAVVSEAGGAPEAIEPGETGFLYEPGDVDGLFNQVQLLLKNQRLRKKMGKKARKWAESKFDSVKHFDRIEEVYQK